MSILQYFRELTAAQIQLLDSTMSILLKCKCLSISSIISVPPISLRLLLDSNLETKLRLSKKTWDASEKWMQIIRDSFEYVYKACTSLIKLSVVYIFHINISAVSNTSSLSYYRTYVWKEQCQWKEDMLKINGGQYRLNKETFLLTGYKVRNTLWDSAVIIISAIFVSPYLSVRYSSSVSLNRGFSKLVVYLMGLIYFP